MAPRRLTVVLVAPALTLVAVVVVVMTALRDSAVVTGEKGLRSVSFGRPLDWLTQDQSAHDPPFPHRATPNSPWENPTGVDVLPFLVEVLGVLAVLVAGWLVVGSLVRRLQQRP